MTKIDEFIFVIISIIVGCAFTYATSYGMMCVSTYVRARVRAYYEKKYNVSADNKLTTNHPWWFVWFVM